MIIIHCSAVWSRYIVILVEMFTVIPHVLCPLLFSSAWCLNWTSLSRQSLVLFLEMTPSEKPDLKVILKGSANGKTESYS